MAVPFLVLVAVEASGWPEGWMPWEAWEESFLVLGKHFRSWEGTWWELEISGCCLPNSCHPFAGPVDVGWLPAVAEENDRMTGPWAVWVKAARKDSCCVVHLLEETVEAGLASQVSSLEEPSCLHSFVQVGEHHSQAVAVGSTDHWDSSSHLSSAKEKSNQSYKSKA